MTQKLPRIASVAAVPPSALAVRFEDGAEETVELAGWIAAGGDLLAPLRMPATFETARLGLHGASVVWGGGEESDLAIDARHLKLLTPPSPPSTGTPP